jgi:hypothetical protein
MAGLMVRTESATFLGMQRISTVIFEQVSLFVQATHEYVNNNVSEFQFNKIC